VWPAVISLIVLLVAAMAILPWLARWMQGRESRRAIEEFRLHREAHESKFFDLASRAGKPRGLVWKKCDWQPAVRFARDRGTRQLTAFVAVEIHFEAVEGGDMEDVAAVGTIRDAAAVFHYQDGRWGTGGRALFNMNPDDAVAKLSSQFEPIVAAGNTLVDTARSAK
jgi:hypothetical protein